MAVGQLIIITCIAFLSISSFVTSLSYDIVSNLTHTCQIRPQVVCVDVMIDNNTCVDSTCLIYSGGNYSACRSAVFTTNSTSLNLTHVNNQTGILNGTTNSTLNSTMAICNATWLYPTNKTFCMDTSSWNLTVCGLNNVTCKVNSTQCSLNPVFYIGGFFNLEHSSGWGNIPAAQMAINQINNDKKDLTNITLSLTAKSSTQGLLSHGTELLYNYLHSGPPKLMLLLPEQVDLARTVAAYAGLKQWGTLQFSYATEDNSLAWNKKLFPRFYRLNPLEISYNRLRAAFVATYPQWKNDVGLLYFSNSYYEEVNNDLKNRLNAKGVNVVANIGFRSSPDGALEGLKEKSAHVILASFPYTYGKKVFCKAYKLGMYGPHYVWILFRLMPLGFLVPTSSDDLDCSEYEMTCTAENHFSFGGAQLKTGNLINKVNVSFSETYYQLVDVGNSTKNRSKFAPYAYDAIWTMADVLRRARSTVEAREKRLTSLNYQDVNETKLFEKIAYETDIKGVTVLPVQSSKMSRIYYPIFLVFLGRIRFFENGNRKFEMNVFQVRSDGVGLYVGNYDEDKDIYTPSGIQWIGGIPYQRMIKVYEWRNIEFVLFIFWCIFAILGILCCIFCLMFIIRHRRDRSIKYSSPTINVFIILGCLLNFTAVILYGIDYQTASDSVVSDLCKARMWIFSIGLTFCIGGLWVKVWTLYQILVERRVYRKTIMEYWMFGILVVFLLIDIIYLAVWTATDELYRTVETVRNQPVYECFKPLSGNPFHDTVTYIEVCDSDNLTLWLGIFLAYKALILLGGFYMSWKVRHVFTRKLVDAQYCGKLLILAVPFCLLGVVFALTLRLYPTPHYALFGIVIIIYSYIVLGFLYGHKIINILYHPTQKIKVHSKDGNTERECCCCPPFVASCVGSLCFCCSLCVTLRCCKVLCNALLYGPRKNRGSFVKEFGDERMDYQIGKMPGDKQRQIIIMQKELEQKEQELLQLRRYQRITQAVKQTQTTGFYINDGHAGSLTSSSGLSNESCEDDNTDKNRVRKPQYNRFKVYHRKLDFSHVSSKVDSGLDGTSFKRNVLVETPDNGSDQWRRGSQDSEILLLQKSLSERDKELAQLKAYLGLSPTPNNETASKIGSLANIGEEYSPSNPVAPSKIKDTDVIVGSINSVVISVDADNTKEDKKELASVNGTKSPNSPNEDNIERLTIPQRERIEVNESTSDDETRSNGAMKEGEVNQQGAKEYNETSKNGNVKIFDFPSNYSHVKSRLYASPYITNRSAKSPKFKRKVRQLSSFGLLRNSSSSIGAVSDDGNRKPGSDSSGQDRESDNSKNRSGVKVFNAPSDYSHVKSRLFDSSLNSSNDTQFSQGNLQKSPGKRRRSQAVEELDSNEQEEYGKENSHYSKNKNNVKIFNAPTDYSHVKSRLFDSSARNNAGEIQGSVKNVQESSSARRPSETNEMNDNANDLDASKENGQYAKNKSNVKIFNAPSDYSHVKSRLFESSSNRSTPDGQASSHRFQRKVQQLSSFGMLKANNFTAPTAPNKTMPSNQGKDITNDSSV